MWATLEQPGVPTEAQKDEMFVLTAPAHRNRGRTDQVAPTRARTWVGARARTGSGPGPGLGLVQGRDGVLGRDGSGPGPAPKGP